MLGLSKVRVYAIVDEYGDIRCVGKDIPPLGKKEYAVPMTMTLGHTWLEGVSAWMANLRSLWI